MANLPFGVNIDSIFFLPILEYLDLAADLIANTETGLVFPLVLKVLNSPLVTNPTKNLSKY